MRKHTAEEKGGGGAEKVVWRDTTVNKYLKIQSMKLCYNT